MADISAAFIGGQQAGQQARLAREQHEEQKKENDLRRMVLKLQMDQMKVKEQIDARKLDQERLAFLEGRPEADLPKMPAPTEGVIPGGGWEMPAAPVTIRAANGLPEDRITPQSAEQLGQQAELKSIADGVRQREMKRFEQSIKPVSQGDAVLGDDGQYNVPNPKPEPVARPVSLDQQLVEALRTGNKAEERIIRQAMNARKTGGDGAAQTTLKRGRLAQTVLDNPSLWDDLTPTDKGEIAPDLAEAGFNGFGRRLSDATISKMAEARSAVTSLRDLRSILQQNEQYIGPLAGLQALNPYSEGRKAQADIDRVRQRVGKAMEGGVLRKEDEEKYKKILATLRDTPDTAIYKVDQLIETLEKDLEAFVEEQRAAGRRVNTPKAGAVLKFDAKGNPIP